MGNSKKKPLLLRLFFLGLKLGFIMLVVMVIISCYYYVVVTNSSLNAEQKWQTPAVVYSRPLELTLEQKITFDQLVHELTLLKYRKVDNPKAPGEYGYSSDHTRMVIIRRPFNFAYGYEEARPIHIIF